MSKKFLVTGGAGFIGSHMTDFLIEKNYEVIIVDNLSTGKIENINKKCEFYNIDLSTENIDFLLNDVDYVIHMAALPSVQESIDNPIETNKHNLISTINLLESIRKFKIKKIVFSSTSAVYGNPINFPTSENENLNPLSPYALQKITSEEYIKLYSKLYNINSICLRYFNVFGERMNNNGAYNSVVSTFMKQKKENQPLTIFNDGEQKRDFIYVKDIVHLNYLSCISPINGFEIYNVGSGINFSVNEIVKVFNHNSKFIGERIEPYISLCDNTKTKNQFNWSPKINVLDWISSKIQTNKI